MIPHWQEYPLRRTVCPSLPIDGRHARPERALLPGRGSKPCTHKQDARDTVKWLTMPDVHGDRSTTTAEHVQRRRRRRSFSFLSFGFLHLVVVASSLLTLSSGSLLLSERMTVLVSFSRQSHTGVLQLLEPFFTGSRSEEEGAEAHGPEDRPSRRRVVLLLPSPLELPAIRLEGILLLTPTRVGLLLQYTRNPQKTGRKRKRSSTHRRSPATNKVVEILILGTVSSPRPLIWLPSCFAKQQSGHSSVIVWFCFSRKSPEKMKKI